MGDLRRSRGERPEQKSWHVVERDESVVYALARWRAAKTSQLARTFFPDRSTCNRRCAKLASLRLVTVVAPESLAAENVYLPGPKASEFLTSRGYAAEELFRARSDAAKDDHLLGMTEVRVAFVLACREAAGAELDLVLADHDLRRTAGHEVPRWVPDLLVILTLDGREERLVLEYDNESESVRWFAEHKGAVAHELASRRSPVWGLTWPWRPLVVATSERRLQSLARALAASRAAEHWFGSTGEKLADAGALGSAWARLANLKSEDSEEGVRWTRLFAG